jgi:hypothetical protein
MKDHRLYLECSCHAPEHTIRFSYIADDDNPELFVDVSLSGRPRWHKRVWNAIKYIFGYRCQYGHFNEFIYDLDEAAQLKEFLEGFLDGKSQT